MSDDFADAVSKALRRAYSLGQTYWQQADSESYSQNRKADDTSRKFAALVDETLALARSGQAASGSSQGARSDEQGCVSCVTCGQPEAPTAAPQEPAAWADDRAIAGGIGNVVSAATKAYWERSHTIDRAMAARMVHPLYAHPPARSGAGSEEARDAARYRWLRPKMSTSRTVYDGHIGPWHINFPTMTSTDDGQPAELLDTAIDAAIAASKPAAASSQPDRSEGA